MTSRLALVSRLREGLLGSSYAKNIRVIATASILGQAIIIAATPILTRLYSTEDFGVLATFSSILGVAPVIATLRYDLAIASARSKREATELLFVCIACTAAFTLLVAAVLFALPLVRNIVIPTQVHEFRWAYVVATLAIGTFVSLEAWLGFNQDFKTIAKVRSTQSVYSVSTQLLCGYWAAGAIGLVLGYIVSQSSGIFRYSRELAKSNVSIPSLGSLLDVAKSQRDYPRFAMPAAVANRLGLHLIPILLASTYGLAVAGYYILAQRLVALPTLVIGRSVAQVYVNKLGAQTRDQETRLRPTYVKTVYSLAILGAAPAATLAVMAPALFAWVFGEDWRTAGEYCQVLSIAFYAQFVISPMSQTLNVLGQKRVQFIWDIMRLAGLLLIFYVAHSANLSVVQAMYLITGVLVATYLAQLALSIHFISRYDRALDAKHGDN